MSEKLVYLPPLQLEKDIPCNYKQFKSQLEKKIKRKIKKFAYRDEEGDLVSITNDLEFQELFRGLSDEIHLQAIIEGAESVEVHSAYCDSCHGTIVGIRYKCVNCADYDLCEACESDNCGDGLIHPKDHLFLKVYHGLNPKRPHCILPNLYKEESPENTFLPEIQGRLSTMEKQLSQIVSQLVPKDPVHDKPKPVNFERAREERKKMKMLRREANRKEKEESRQGAWRCDRRQRDIERKERRLQAMQERIAEEEAARRIREAEERRIEEEARRIEEEEARRFVEEEAKRIKEKEEAEEERRIKEELERRIKEAEEEAEEAEEMRLEEEKKIKEEEIRSQEEKIDPRMEQLLAMLNSMGFTDKALNLRLLKEHRANVALVIEELLV